jgi:hypothetical protein
MPKFLDPKKFAQNIDVSGSIDKLGNEMFHTYGPLLEGDELDKIFKENIAIENLDISPRQIEAFDIKVKEAIEEGGFFGDPAEEDFAPLTIEITKGRTFNAPPPKSDKKSLPLPNSLRSYTHYNYIITLAVLTDEELNLPDQTIRQGLPKNIIMRSTGGAGDSKATTAFEINGNKIEFFIDDLEIKSVVSPNSQSRHATATQIRFNVTEPYSMGLLPQALEMGCINAGHANYLEAPMALIIEFQGWDEEGKAYTIPDTRRVISCKWVSGQFQAGQSGSVYEMVMVPYNELAYSDVVQNLPVDVSVSGRTLNEMLQTGFSSLASTINTHLLSTKENTYVHEQDEYIIVFPKDKASFNQILEEGVRDNSTTTTSGSPQQRNFDRYAAYQSMTTGLTQNLEFASSEEINQFFEDQAGFTLRRSNLSEAIKQYNENDSNVNDMGRAAVKIDDPLGPGANPYVSAFYNYDSETNLFTRDNITIDPAQRQIKFKQGEKIQRIIEELVCISEIGFDIGPMAYPDDLGMVPWFRLETQVFNVGNAKQEAQSGRKPRVYVYRVVPYKVHHSVFAAPNQPYKGYNELAAQAAKEYDYIYTGKNDDVLDFNLEFKNTFYAALAPDGGNNSANNSVQDGASVPNQPRGAASDNGEGTKTESPATIERDPRGDNNSSSAGSTAETAAVRTARRFNDAIVNSDVDLLVATMQIWGDPFWLSDSGMGNYMARPTNLFNVNSDEQADYQNGQNDIIINFRTPVDLKDNGMFSFPQEFVNVEGFSGLYMVINVTNMFQQGKFTQELQLIRRRNQRLKDLATDENTSPVQEIAIPEKLIAELQATGATPAELDQIVTQNIQKFGTLNVQDIVSKIPGVDDVEATVGNIFSRIGVDQAGIDKALKGIDGLEQTIANATGNFTGTITDAVNGNIPTINAATFRAQSAALAGDLGLATDDD